MTTSAFLSIPPLAERHASSLISVIIPTYNRAWSLECCINSVRQQSYRPLECVVVDDGSTDATPVLLGSLAKAAVPGVDLRIIRTEHRGANHARNRGMAESRGEYLCFLDSDDMLPAESVSVRAAALNANPDADFCYGLCSVRDESGRELRRINSPWPAPGEARISRYLFCATAPLIRRALCTKAGFWREDDSHGQEFEYFARIKGHARHAIFLDQVLSIYVKHNRESLFDRSPAFFTSLLRMLGAIKDFVRNGPHDSPAERRELAKEYAKVGGALCRVRNYPLARAAWQESLGLNFRLRVLVRLMLARVRAR